MRINSHFFDNIWFILEKTDIFFESFKFYKFRSNICLSFNF